MRQKLQVDDDRRLRRQVIGAHVIVLVCIAFAMVYATRANAADAASGRALSERLCASCHVISDESGRTATTTDSVPSFIAMANDPAMTEPRLRGFLNVPHPAMPDLGLDRRQIDDIVAHIQSLRRK